MLGILGKKIGMTRIYDEKGLVVPVTVVEAGPCPVLQVKREATDGYCALQIGFGSKKAKNTTKAELGHLKKAGAAPQKIVRELRVDDTGEFEAGGNVDVSIFEPGDIVDVTGVSKGRGFAGAIKRHNSSRGPESHGSRYHRRPGSMGASSDPSRVFKGKKSPGQMGAKRSTTQGMRVVKVDKERNVLVLRGAVPGHNSGYVLIHKSAKAAAKAARHAKK